MPRLPSFNNQVRIGVSISDRSIEMVEVAMGAGGTMQVRAVAVGALEKGVVEHGAILDPGLLATALRQTYISAKPRSFTTQTLYVALPDHVTYFHIFRFPGSLTNPEIRNALSFQVEEVIPFPAETLVGDFSVLSRSVEETVVAYAVANKLTVEQVQTAVSRAGFRLGGVGLEVQALARVLLGGVREGKGSLVMDIGETATTMFVRDSHDLYATFSVPVAGGVFTQAILKQKRLGADKAEELKRREGMKALGAKQGPMHDIVNELAAHAVKVIRWYEQVAAPGHIDEIVLAGGTSQMPGLVEALHDTLKEYGWEGELRKGDPLARAADSPLVSQMRTSSLALAVAPALGIAAHNRASGKSFEFLSSFQTRDPFVFHLPTRAMFSKKHIKEGLAAVPERQKMILAGLLIAVALSLLGAALYSRMQQERRIDEELQRLNEETVLAEEDVAAVDLFFSATGDPSAIPARLVSIETVQPVDVVPDTVTTVEGVARGSVILFNETDRDQTLVRTTRLLSESGVLFRTDADVVVPAGSSAGVAIYADEPGAGGDIGPTRFTIPGLPASLQTSVYAVSSEPTTGGVQSRGVLTQTLVDAALLDARQLLEERLPQILPLAEGEMWRPELVEITQLSVQTSTPIGEEGEAPFVVTSTYHVQAFLFAETFAPEEGMNILVQEIDWSAGQAHLIVTPYPQAESASGE